MGENINTQPAYNSNYMNPIMLNSLVTMPTSPWNMLTNAFIYAQLGTGTSANPLSSQNLETPILSRANWNIWVGAAGGSAGGFMVDNVNYNSTYCREVSITDTDTGKQYNTVRTRYRMSHRHPIVPSTQTTPLVVSEIGWSHNENGAMNSRIVLPPADRITLQSEQFLVTIYEVDGILPDLRVKPFSNLAINGAFQWGSLSTYILGQVATYGGVNYKSLIDNNIDNIPPDSPTAWEVDTMTTLSLSGQYAFRGAYPKHTSPVVGIITFPAWNHLRFLAGDNLYSIQMGPASTMLVEGDGPIGGSYIYPAANIPVVADNSQADNGVLTIICTSPRDERAALNNVRSIFILGHQFLLEHPISIAPDQTISITASRQWNLVRGVDS